MIGTIKKWIDERGFGFIAPAGGDRDVFVHVSACRGADELSEGARVEYQEERDPRTGKWRAANVRVIEIGP